MPSPNRRLNIVSDSCCDLPRDLYDSFEIGLLPFTYIMDDGEHYDDLYQSITPHQFFERLRKGEIAQTTQVPYNILLEYLEKAAQEPLPTVFFCFSSGLSGTYESMAQACEEVSRKYPESELYVVDTLLPSAGEGLLVWEAVRMADRGMSARELVAWAEEARYFVNG
ncbi:MAG: DegV family EDD domain-containing protein, partial [Coriobacteriia bacterium]|nr:DegV family EDD domain-containing protein [Coriobacteriia bacterium]